VELINKTLESLIKKGIIGASLGSMLLSDQEEGLTFGLILGAAISATMSANNDAKMTNIPIYIEEKGKLFAIEPSGTRRFIKNIKKINYKFPEKFKLE
jgi:hypothetical protein